MTLPFLSLPREIRNQIYRYVLVGEAIAVDQRYRWPEWITGASQLMKWLYHPPNCVPDVNVAMLRTCHQIIDEAITIFLEENVFWFNGRRISPNKNRYQRRWSHIFDKICVNMMIPLRIRPQSMAMIQHLAIYQDLFYICRKAYCDWGGRDLATRIYVLRKYLRASLKTFTLEVNVRD